MAADESALQHTSLYEFHLQQQAKMVPFAGYSMPVQYATGIKAEHLHCRTQAGLFDVSHMGQVLIKGSGATAALERIVPVDLQGLALGKQTYAVFTDDNGGILDDLMISRWGANLFYLVVNAACKEQDIAHLRQHLRGLTVEPLTNCSLIALQGPMAREVIGGLTSVAANLTFMRGMQDNLGGAPCYISCSGYTGEDGFEISFEAKYTQAIVDALMSDSRVKPIGLGARDSLRLEAGLCLYGHDMDTTTNPIEAALGWSISKARRADGERPGGFPGADTILAAMAAGPARKRVGLKVQSRQPVREGAELQDAQGDNVGVVTSGGFSPCLEAPIAMGYVNAAHSRPDTALQAIVRGKAVPVSVCTMPFVPQRYYR